MWIKSHVMYGQDDYPKGLDCFASFRVPAENFVQNLKFEIVKGSIAGDAYFAFGNDYGDQEKFTDVLDSGITRQQTVQINMENRRRYNIHFHSGTQATSTGFLAKVTVWP